MSETTMRSEQLAIFAPLYLTKLGGEIPAGRVVVHNQVRPTRRLGSRGFRAWLAEPSERLVLCGCDWAPELGEHYRVKEEILRAAIARVLPPDGVDEDDDAA